jgi:hypothetical protein
MLWGSYWPWCIVTIKEIKIFDVSEAGNVSVFRKGEGF